MNNQTAYTSQSPYLNQIQSKTQVEMQPQASSSDYKPANTETSNTIPSNLEIDQSDLTQILKIFQKYQLKESEDVLKRELNKKAGVFADNSIDPSQK